MSGRRRHVEIADAILRGEAVDWAQEGASADPGQARVLDNLELLHRMRNVQRAAPVSLSVPGFDVLQKIGEGGTGVVYEAQQVQPKRRVALKILRSGSGEVGGRSWSIKREAQALANLTHPNVASIHTAGTTLEGNDFFVMELIEGVHFDRALENWPMGAGADRLHLRERLELFLQVLDAVEYAHRQGVIHRDLKPGNVLVEGQPPATAKVLDFGLAKITRGEASLALTMSGVVQGTLAYMSPEQALGRVEQIDVRSDVYSLGVMLYELVTGSRPHDVESVALATALQRVAEEPAPRASRVRSIARGDLDTIIAKALAKDRGARYPTVNALAEDVRRYLNGRVILARPPSMSYQLRRFVARHRLLVGASAAVFLTVLGAAIGTSVLYRQQLQATRRSEQSNEILRETLAALSPRERAGERLGTQRILDSARDRLVAGPDDPAVVGDNLAILADLYAQNGYYHDAEDTYRAAVDRLRTSGDPEALARALVGAGRVAMERGRIGSAQLRFDEAARLWVQLDRPAQQRRVQLHAGHLATRNRDLREAESVFRTLLDRDSGDGVFRAQAQQRLATVLIDTGRLTEARDVVDKWEVETRETFDTSHLVHTAVRFVRAQLAFSAGELEEAGRRMVACLGVWRSSLGPAHPRTALAELELASVWAAEGRVNDAERLARDAIFALQGSLGPDHDLFARALVVMGGVVEIAGHLDEAEELLEDALAIHARGVESVEDDGARAAVPLLRLASLRARRGDAEGAREILDRLEGFVVDRAPWPTLNLLAVAEAEIARSRGNFARSSEALLAAVERCDAALGADHFRRIPLVIDLADARARSGRVDEAQSLLLEVEERLARGDILESHPLHAQLGNGKAVLAWCRGDLEAAERYLRSTAELVRTHQNGYTREYVLTLQNLGDVLLERGRLDEAERTYVDAMNRRWKRLGADHPDNAAVYRAIAEVEQRRGNRARAESYALRAYEVRREAFGEEDPRTRRAARGLATLLAEQGVGSAAEPAASEHEPR